MPKCVVLGNEWNLEIEKIIFHTLQIFQPRRYPARRRDMRNAGCTDRDLIQADKPQDGGLNPLRYAQHIWALLRNFGENLLLRLLYL